jgi:UDPglucose 6-dehydrogenase
MDKKVFDIGIIGMGIVGGTTAKVLGKIHRIHPYDKYKKEYNDVEGLINSDVVFVCVPTPMKASGEIDYSPIYNSLSFLSELAEKYKKYPLVVIRSTAVSGTTDRLAQEYPKFKFVFNPEFLTEKNALNDMENTDRIVIGVDDEESKEKVLAIYKPLFFNAKYILVNRKTAEMIKYAANVFLASQIGIANEIYNICKAIEVDYNIIKNTILFDKRIGTNIGVPGPDGDFGFGGKCFPKDLNALIYLARENMYRPYLLEEVWRLNERVRKNKDWLKIEGATSKNNLNKK